MFKTRLLSGIVLVILMIGILYFGGYVTGVATLMLAIAGEFELLRIYGIHNKLLGYITYIVTVLHFVVIVLLDTAGCAGTSHFYEPSLILPVILLLAIYVIRYPEYSDKDIAAAILAFFYVGIMFSFFYRIRELKYGGLLVILVFVCSWVNDTCAYCVGVTMGKHKMTPKLSPKKSIEGLIGGIAGSALVGFGYGMFLESKEYFENISGSAPVLFAVIGALGAIVAVIGDLTASAIKRNNDIKDYSKLIPGHGGILDRFDSIIFVSPIVYYLLVNFA